jgi:PE-PPE domain
MLERLSVAAAIIGAIAVPISQSVHADVTLLSVDDPLSGSDTAIIVGGTFESTPNTTFADTAEELFLNPLGFDGGAIDSAVCDMVGSAPCDAPLQVLTTPELVEEGPSTLQAEADIVSAVEAEYATGDFSSTDPLTVFAYSQSAIAASAAMTELKADDIPLSAVHFVFIGDPSDPAGVATNIYSDLVSLLGTTFTNELLDFVDEDQFAPGGSLAGDTPTDLYPTTIYTIDGDGVAEWQTDWDADGGGISGLLNALYNSVTTHAEYLGLTASEIAAGVTTVDGSDTTIAIPDTFNNADAFLDALLNGIGSSGLLQSLSQSILDLFNSNYF